MRIELTEKKLTVDGSPCSSITVVKRLDGTYQIVMFDNPKYMKTKMKYDKWKRTAIPVILGRRFIIIRKTLEFIGLKPKKQIGYLAEFHLRNDNTVWFYVATKKGNYINYYEKIKPEQKVIH